MHLEKERCRTWQRETHIKSNKRGVARHRWPRKRCGIRNKRVKTAEPAGSDRNEGRCTVKVENWRLEVCTYITFYCTTKLEGLLPLTQKPTNRRCDLPFYLGQVYQFTEHQ